MKVCISKVLNKLFKTLVSLTSYLSFYAKVESYLRYDMFLMIWYLLFHEETAKKPLRNCKEIAKTAKKVQTYWILFLCIQFYLFFSNLFLFSFFPIHFYFPLFYASFGVIFNSSVFLSTAFFQIYLGPIVLLKSLKPYLIFGAWKTKGRVVKQGYHKLRLQHLYISMVTVVEFHCEPGEIQYVFAPQWTPSKDFLTNCKTIWGGDIKDRT